MCLNKPQSPHALCHTDTLLRGSRPCNVFVSKAVHARRCDNPASDVQTLPDTAYRGLLPTFRKLHFQRPTSTFLGCGVLL
jgi:hypothetical protein